MRYKHRHLTEKKARSNIPAVIQVILSSLVRLQVFEVGTNTRIRDLIQNISKKLDLASADGFSIFVKTHDKVYFDIY